MIKPLDDIITNEFIPALFGSNVSANERELFAMPIKDGGLGIKIWHKHANISYETSKGFTAPLQDQILNQKYDLPDQSKVKSAKDKSISAMKLFISQDNENIFNRQTLASKRNLTQLSKLGSSSWLSALPLEDQGFNLNKSEFQDAVNLRYDKTLKRLPAKCPCGSQFTITHAMNCHRGGFINSRHDAIRNFEGRMLKQVCSDVEIEPMLQPIVNTVFHRSANISNEARLDLRAKSFWRQGQNAFFDVRITNADCNSQQDKDISSILKKHEQEKKRAYNSRIMEIDQGTFTPLIYTVKGATGSECQIFHKNMAEKISIKSNERYEDVSRFIRVKLSSLVLKAALQCIR